MQLDAQHKQVLETIIDRGPINDNIVNGRIAARLARHQYVRYQASSGRNPGGLVVTQLGLHELNKYTRAIHAARRKQQKVA